MTNFELLENIKIGPCALLINSVKKENNNNNNNNKNSFNFSIFKLN
jgi:hypothetical protein